MRCGGRVLRVVVDTNVWVSGRILPDSVPGRVLQAVRDRRVTAVASWTLADEIAGVLRRPKLVRYGIIEADVRDVLALLAPFLPTVEVDAPVRDPKDRAVIEAAVAGEVEAIVTGDSDLLDDKDLRRRLAERGIRILTPKELLAALGRRSRGRLASLQ